SRNAKNSACRDSQTFPTLGLRDFATLRPVGAGGFALRLGFRLIGGLSEQDGRRIVAARTGSFPTFVAFARRARLGQPALVRLARADAFRSLGLERRA